MRKSATSLRISSSFRGIYHSSFISLEGCQHLMEIIFANCLNLTCKSEKSLVQVHFTAKKEGRFRYWEVGSWHWWPSWNRHSNVPVIIWNSCLVRWKLIHFDPPNNEPLSRESERGGKMDLESLKGCLEKGGYEDDKNKSTIEGMPFRFFEKFIMHGLHCWSRLTWAAVCSMKVSPHLLVLFWCY